MIVPPTGLITPLNMPLQEYCQLCADATGSLPPIRMFPLLVTDTNGPSENPMQISFQAGFAAARLDKYFWKYSYGFVGDASNLISYMGPSIRFRGPKPDSDVSFAISNIKMKWEPHVVVLPDSIAAELDPLQKQWISDAKYVIFGFCDDGLKPSKALYDAIGTGLVMLDRHVIEANSTDPNTHTPLNVSALAAQDFEQIVAAVYSNGNGAWHWTLCALQTILLVYFRAFRSNRVPSKAATRFITNGGRHHTDDKA